MELENLNPARRRALEQAVNANLAAFSIRATFAELQYLDFDSFDRATQGVLITCMHDAGRQFGLVPLFDRLCVCDSCTKIKELEAAVRKWAAGVVAAGRREVMLGSISW